VGESVIERVRADRLQARRDREAVRVGALGGLLSALEDAAKASPARVLDAQEEIAVLRREHKRRVEAAASFREGEREDDARREEDEGRIIEAYLPAALGEDELLAIVDAAIAATGATSPRELGAVMKIVVGQVAGRADGKTVSTLVRGRLGS
jgi:uncharacterized protein YqeY